jgi:predicted transcriptional regulator
MKLLDWLPTNTSDDVHLVNDKTSQQGVEVRRQRALDEVARLSRNVYGLLVLARQDQSNRAAELVDVSQLCGSCPVLVGAHAGT